MRRLGIDFVRPARPPALGWFVLLAGLLLTGLATDRFLSMRQRQAAQAQARTQHSQALAEQARQMLAMQPIVIPPYVDDKRWQRAATDLSLPWLNTLEALEKVSKPPIFLLGLRSDPISGRLQLDAEAPDLDAALNYVSALQAQAGLTNTQLLAHDESPDQQGRQQVRFSLQTQWVVAR
jgi:hypothetical protein